MKAAIAILADYPTQNFCRRLVFAMDQHAPVEFFGSLLPAHVSLKQPFAFEDMQRLEDWFDAFARRTAPFDVSLDSVYYTEWQDSAIFGLNVVETPALRELHNKINGELKEVVSDPSAAFDGEAYRFHLTIELGPTGKANPYKALYDRVEEKKVALTFRAGHLALFYYASRPITPGSFMIYKVQPLG